MALQAGGTLTAEADKQAAEELLKWIDFLAQSGLDSAKQLGEKGDWLAATQTLEDTIKAFKGMPQSVEAETQLKAILADKTKKDEIHRREEARRGARQAARQGAEAEGGAAALPQHREEVREHQGRQDGEEDRRRARGPRRQIAFRASDRSSRGPRSRAIFGTHAAITSRCRGCSRHAP